MSDEIKANHYSPFRIKENENTLNMKIFNCLPDNPPDVAPNTEMRSKIKGRGGAMSLIVIKWNPFMKSSANSKNGRNQKTRRQKGGSWTENKKWNWLSNLNARSARFDPNRCKKVDRIITIFFRAIVSHYLFGWANERADRMSTGYRATHFFLSGLERS